MSWVQVECSNGTRYVAPSHGRPLPSMSGLAQLFQPPLGLRQLRTFTVLDVEVRPSSDGCVADVNQEATPEVVPVLVLIDQRDLGGHLGLTTVVVGGEDPKEEVVDSSSSSSVSAAGRGARLLLERVFALLRCTNEAGVRCLLDALCTRTPLPLTISVAATVAVVREDDGGGAKQAPNAKREMHGMGAGTSNERFLRRLGGATSSQHGGTDGDVETMISTTLAGSSVPLQALSANTAAAAGVGKCSTTPATNTTSTVPTAGIHRTRLPLSYAAAVRRSSLLFFVRHDVVPLSLLYAQLRSFCDARLTPTLSGNVSTATTADIAVRHRAWMIELMQHVRGSRDDQILSSSPNASPVRPLAGRCLTCTSALQRKGRKLLTRSPGWAAVAQLSEMSGKMIVWSVLRLLLPPLPQAAEEATATATALEELLLGDLWCSPSFTRVASDGASVEAVPLMAAFTPSGLLTSSTAFRLRLTHGEALLLAAAAVDRLTRCTSLLAKDGTPAPSLRCGEVLRWVTWPMLLGGTDDTATTKITAPAKAEKTLAVQTLGTVMDVLLITVGDALALCLLLPRVQASTQKSCSASLDKVLRALERLQQASSPRSAMREWAEAAVYVCTHSTAPYTTAFYDALSVITAAEEELSGTPSSTLTSPPPRDGGPPLQHATSPPLSATADSGAASTAAHNPTSAASRNVHFAATTTTTANTMKTRTLHSWRRRLSSGGAEAARKGIAKVFAVLPLSKKQREMRRSTSSRFAGRTTDVSDAAAAPPSSYTDTSSFCAALASIPLADMLCLVASLLTRNELVAFRLGGELGLHSFFFLQLPSAEPRSSSSKGGNAKGFASALELGRGNSNVVTVNNPVRYGISFSRTRLQQSGCPVHHLPEEWANVEGCDDGRGGPISFLEDPALTLDYVDADGRGSLCDDDEGHSGEELVGGAWLSGTEKDNRHHSKGHKPSHRNRRHQRPQVSVLPVWSILHVAPDECVAARSSGDKGGTRSGSSPAQQQEEDAQLLTSIAFSTSQTLYRYESEEALAPPSSSRSVTPQRVAVAKTHTSFPTSTIKLTLPPKRSQPKPPTKESVTVQAVLNVCGDITGKREEVLVHALHAHALARGEKVRLRNGGHQGEGLWEKEDKVASRCVHVDPVSRSYAMTAPERVKELCRELVWSQTAALGLLEAASSAL